MSEKLRHLFFKSVGFKRDAERLNAWSDVDDLKLILDENPTAGDVIRAGNGLRKIRMPLPGRGKSGGARVIYFQIVGRCIIFVDVFAKNEKSDLSPVELANAIAVRDQMIVDLKDLEDGKNSR